MTKLMKFGLIPAIIVLSIAAIAVNVCYRLIKEPPRGEAVTVEMEKTRLPQPGKVR